MLSRHAPSRTVLGWDARLIALDARHPLHSPAGQVHPPRLDGAKVGLFSTRTPHRPNAIGLSLVKLSHVAGDTLHLTGVDLVDGEDLLVASGSSGAFPLLLTGCDRF